MKIFRTIKETTSYIKTLKKQGKTIGLVPTMGYLHEGHLSLMCQSKKDCDITLISIFVNPTQFSPKEDFKKYPRNFKRDERLAKDVGVDVIFYPTVKEMYPTGYNTYASVEGLTHVMCGASRPGHFRGVTTIVAKLFNIVQPDIAYFGQKDAQQTIVIKKMVKDLDMSIKIETLPIIREKDGLAMSSRNAYLSKRARKDAAILYKSLKKAEKLIKNGEKNAEKLIKIMYNSIHSKKTAVVDYISIVDAENLKELKKVKKKALIALAIWIEKVRLIDNIVIDEEKHGY